jgi:hypothetical protein
MTRNPSPGDSNLPTWLIVVGSVAVVYHLAAIVVPILDTPSGPWITPMGRAMDDPPHFAHSASGLSTLHGKYLRIAHSYHFMTNRPGDNPGVEFEVRLRNEDGAVTETLHFPDPKANPWVRYRQELLASGLAPDLPVQQTGGEVIAAAGGKVPEVSYWALPEDTPVTPGTNPMQVARDRKVQLQLVSVDQNLVPRTREVMRPNDWTLVLVRAYTRHLCRLHGAATAEIVRHTREPVTPAPLFNSEVPAQAFEDLVASFGKRLPKEETTR